jgi:uncharacterized SAM-binding protein YcdF (DUF218 family)
MSLRILLAELLLPPTSLVIIGLVLLMHSRHGRVLGAGALTVLLTLGLPIVSSSLLASLNDPPDIPSAAPQAIVILAGDVMGATSGQPKPGLLTLERLQEGAALHRRTGLPILVTGGPIKEGSITNNVIQTDIFSHADIMTRSLWNDFLVPVHWRENRSQDTWQNAEYSAAILRTDNIHIVYLVTQAWHMRRALYAFRHFGVNAIAAPVQPDRWPDVEPGGFIPSTRAWQESYYGLHEWIGLIYYRLFR